MATLSQKRQGALAHIIQPEQCTTHKAHKMSLSHVHPRNIIIISAIL